MLELVGLIGSAGHGHGCPYVAEHTSIPKFCTTKGRLTTLYESGCTASAGRLTVTLPS